MTRRKQAKTLRNSGDGIGNNTAKEREREQGRRNKADQQAHTRRFIEHGQAAGTDSISFMSKSISGAGQYATA